LLAACGSTSNPPGAAADPEARADAAAAGDTPADALFDAAAPATSCRSPGTEAATAGCLEPTQPPEYYIDQAQRYFDTLDVSADRARVPAYSELVARWEWPPWLLLTGWGRENLVTTADALRQLDPSTVPERDCRFFAVQPFARCYVRFAYEKGPCPIYEEFVFNDAGEMTFIEAWSDVDGLRPTSREDPFGEVAGFPRLSTRLPGLGQPDGRLDLEGEALASAAATDPDIANFVPRAKDFWRTWAAEVGGAPDDFFARGCGWSASDDGSTDAGLAP
jgi:hypothetical protein